MFPFMIKNQQRKLKRRWQTLPKETRGREAITKCIASENYAYVLYSSRTNTFSGKVKSFVPFTENFKLRMICAKRISFANNVFKREGKIIHKKEDKKEFCIRKCYSDSEVDVIKNYKSPISQSINDYKKTNNKRKFFTVRANVYFPRVRRTI